MNDLLKVLDDDLRVWATLPPDDREAILVQWAKTPLFSMSRREQAWYQATQHHPPEVALMLLDSPSSNPKEWRRGLSALLNRGLASHLADWSQRQPDWSSRWVPELMLHLLMLHLLSDWTRTAGLPASKEPDFAQSMRWLAPQLKASQMEQWLDDWTNHVYDLHADDDDRHVGGLTEEEADERAYEAAMRALDRIGPMLRPKARQVLLDKVEACYLPDTLTCQRAAERQVALEHMPLPPSAASRRYRG